MSDDGRTSDNKNLQAVAARIMTNVVRSQLLRDFLLRAGTLQKGISQVFIPYIQPTISVIYAFFLLVVACVMYKKKMIGVFQGVFLLSNFFDMFPSLLQTPLIIVFYHVADPNVPMPFPWCAIYFQLMGPLKNLGHMIASYLNLLLGINRMCAVYTPLNLNNWFSRKRTIAYCCTMILGGIIFYIGKQAAEPGLFTRTWVDDLWKTNEMEFYTVCALDRIFDPFERQYALYSVQLILLLIPSILLIVISVLLVKKLRLRRLQNEKLHETANQNQQANERINIMNRVAIWVFVSFINTEFPIFALKVYRLYSTLNEYFNGLEDFSRSDFYYTELFDVVYECLLPVNLITYIVLSKRLHKEIKQCLKIKPMCTQHHRK